MALIWEDDIDKKLSFKISCPQDGDASGEKYSSGSPPSAAIPTPQSW